MRPSFKKLLIFCALVANTSALSMDFDRYSIIEPIQPPDTALLSAHRFLDQRYNYDMVQASFSSNANFEMYQQFTVVIKSLATQQPLETFLLRCSRIDDAYACHVGGTE